MATQPDTRSHLLLIGPPGSGKTTSARMFVQALHGATNKNLFGRALFLNSSDERGLEAVRSRVYPFIRSSFDTLFQQTGPKVIIFDEAETLTDQAQIALRPLLDMSPARVMIIFLCNSISRIHASILHKFLTIPFEAPKVEDFQFRMKTILHESSDTMSGLDIKFRRGDIRFFLLNPNRHSDCAQLWNQLFTTHATQLPTLFEQTLPRWTFSELAMFCLFAAKSLGTLSVPGLQEMLRMSDTDFTRQCAPRLRAQLLADWFDVNCRQKLESWPPSAPT